MSTLPLFPAERCDITPQTAEFLAALMDLGLSKEFAAAFLDMAGVHPDHLRWLRGPVVQHRSAWMDLTPSWLFKAVPGERLRIVLDEHARGEVGWLVGPAELAAVMQPASLDAPLSYAHTQLFLWASAHAVARRDDKPLEDIWRALGGAPVTDAQVTQPGGAFYEDYRHLASEIRRKVIQAQKARERSPRSRAPRPTPSRPDTVQLSLF